MDVANNGKSRELMATFGSFWQLMAICGWLPFVEDLEDPQEV